MLDLINDCLHFVTRYFEIINTSAPHIYHSALALAPQESIIRRLYQPYAHPFVRLMYGAPTSWDQNTVAKTCHSEITQAAWSPCNQFFAIVCCRSGVSCAYVLDSVTFQQLQTLEFLQDTSERPLALIFSPDSSILTCFSSSYSRDNFDGELFVISWDLQTGGIASVIRWQQPNQSLVVDSSITYLANGKLVGTLYGHHKYTKTFNISICNVASGVYMSSHLLNCDTPLLSNIGTYGESLQFATADTTAITIWEVRFISGGTPIKVKTLPIPDPFDFPPHINRAQFLPSRCLLALASLNKVLVWDVQNSRCLLGRTHIDSYPTISFSSNGHFFAYATLGDVYLFKESPTGYILHKTLQLGCPKNPDHNQLNPLLSWNGESIAVHCGHTIQLWQTNCFTTKWWLGETEWGQGIPITGGSEPQGEGQPQQEESEASSGTSTPAPESSEDFILDFSPDGMLAAVARRNDDMAMVLNLKSGVLQLTIDTGCKVCGLGVIGNTVVVTSDGKAIAWNIPAEGCVPDDWMDLENSSWMINLKDLQAILDNSKYNEVFSASISPKSHYIALSMWISQDSDTPSKYLCIYSTSTGERLGYEPTKKRIALFTPDGCNIWCTTNGYEAEVWSVGSGQNVLEHLGHSVDVGDPPEGYPWASSQGYEVTDDSWILGPYGKRLLMLPPPWQSHMVHRIWKGQFLALLHGGLFEPVILELEP
jgi:hypothetical protein